MAKIGRREEPITPAGHLSGCAHRSPGGAHLRPRSPTRAGHRARHRDTRCPSRPTPSQTRSPTPNKMLPSFVPSCRHNQRTNLSSNTRHRVTEPIRGGGRHLEWRNFRYAGKHRFALAKPRKLFAFRTAAVDHSYLDSRFFFSFFTHPSRNVTLFAFFVVPHIAFLNYVDKDGGKENGISRLETR